MIDMLDVAKTTSDYSKQVIEYLPQLIKEYKEGDITNASTNMLDLLEGIEYILKTAFIYEDKANIDEAAFSDVLMELKDGMENSDNRHIADVLHYEFNPLMEDLLKKMEKLISDSLN